MDGANQQQVLYEWPYECGNEKTVVITGELSPLSKECRVYSLNRRWYRGFIKIVPWSIIYNGSGFF
ncbi:hypothetical protein GCM10012290_20060 [Halolactibacillus alkaliphilus]|uniref:Uncharacterized protein n=1 Tax=Halolactibacillus alkaliphilus TaxID=442899 RepID=A0A511X3N7_9BACI|nr:hypothetical protein HAL01_20240 [Halolactibacillus alkaliphilus]GGN73341.1 hypothetical protein GCM10012290_20060 [Halolactibacillus alkaliphilus]